MHRLVAALVTLAFLVSGAAALAAGPAPYVVQGGAGVLSADGKTRYVAVTAGNGTAIERLRVRGGSVLGWTSLNGAWGIAAPTVSQREGLSRDGARLLVGGANVGAPSRFMVLDVRTWRVLDRFTLNGDFAYDALSPDGSTLYLVQHVDANNANRYVVRAYDLDGHRLLPGRIADKTQRGWVMEGFATTRTTSADGRWVYTLYQRPGGYPFIHALDTVQGVAHCIGLPWHGNQSPLFAARLTLGDGGRTLAVRLKSGRTRLTVNTANWRLTHVRQGGSGSRLPLAAAGGSAALALALGLAALARRRRGARERLARRDGVGLIEV